MSESEAESEAKSERVDLSPLVDKVITFIKDETVKFNAKLSPVFLSSVVSAILRERSMLQAHDALDAFTVWSSGEYYGRKFATTELYSQLQSEVSKKRPLAGIA